MTRLILALGLAVILGFFSAYSASSFVIESARAQGADSVAVVDAGVQPLDAGVGTVGALPDLGTPDANDPLIVVRTVREVKEREGLWAAIAAGLYLLLKLLQMGSWSFTAFLRRGKMPAIIAGSTGLVGSVYEYLSGAVTGYAVILALIVGVTALVTAIYTPPQPKV